MRICFDTETPTCYAPDGINPPVCLTWSPEHDKDNGRIAVGDEMIDLWDAWIADPNVSLVAHNAPFDFCVMAKASAKRAGTYTRPGFGPAFELVFRAYETGRAIDTIPRQRLIDVARGRHGDDTRMGTLAKRLLKMDMSDDKSMPGEWKHLLGTPVALWPQEARDATPWRFKYGLLEGVPLSDWPDEPRRYAIHDPVTTWGIYDWQEKAARKKPFSGIIINEREQTRAALDLHLHSLTGFATDRPRVQRIMSLYSTIKDACAELLVTHCALCGGPVPPTPNPRGVTRAAKEKAPASDPRWGNCPKCGERCVLIREKITHAPDPVTGKKPRKNHGTKKAPVWVDLEQRTERVGSRSAKQRLVWTTLGPSAPLTKTHYQNRSPKRQDTISTDADTLVKVAAHIASGRASLITASEILASADSVESVTDLVTASDLPVVNAIRWHARSEKYLSAFLSPLDTDRRVRTSYQVCKDTGRTSARKPNCQNFPRPDDKIAQCMDIRSCIIPDGPLMSGWTEEDGRYVFLVCDYGQIELVGFAHVLNVLGRMNGRGEDYESSLARAINDGMDGHIMVAAEVLHMSYDECMGIYKRAKAKAKRGEPLTRIERDVVRWRQVGKIQNYGAAGGMGARTFVTHASKQDAVISYHEACLVRDAWLRAWSPDVPDYFAANGKDTNMGSILVPQLYSGRLRGKCTFTTLSNTMFQGLCADGAKEAMRMIVDACFRQEDSPLYGCRPSLYVHDEFVLLAPDPLEGWGKGAGYSNADAWKLYRAAKAKDPRKRDEMDECTIHRAERPGAELSRLMIEGMAKYIPDVRITADCDIMDRWGKG